MSRSYNISIRSLVQLRQNYNVYLNIISAPPPPKKLTQRSQIPRHGMHLMNTSKRILLQNWKISKKNSFYDTASQSDMSYLELMLRNILIMFVVPVTITTVKAVLCDDHSLHRLLLH